MKTKSFTRVTATLVPLFAAVFMAAILSAPPAVHGQSTLPAPGNIAVAQGSNAGEAEVTWGPVDGADFYLVGWLSRTDYQAAGDNWLERFTFADVESKTSYLVTRLTPGEYYWFIVAAKATRYGQPTWPEAWQDLTLDSDDVSCPTAETATASDCVAEGTCLPIEEIGVFSGAGDSLQDVFPLPAGLYRFTASRVNTEGNFFIDVIEVSSGDSRSVGIYGRGKSGGQKALTIYGADRGFGLTAGNYILEVDTDYDWTVSVELLAAH